MPLVRIVCIGCARITAREFGGGTYPTRCLRCQRDRERELRRLWDNNRRRRTFYPCRLCQTPCAHRGGRCRECFHRERPDMRDGEVIGTYEHPPHPDPLMERHLAALHERARQRLPLFPRRPPKVVEAVRAS